MLAAYLGGVHATGALWLCMQMREQPLPVGELRQEGSGPGMQQFCLGSRNQSPHRVPQYPSGAFTTSVLADGQPPSITSAHTCLRPFLLDSAFARPWLVARPSVPPTAPGHHLSPEGTVWTSPAAARGGRPWLPCLPPLGLGGGVGLPQARRALLTGLERGLVLVCLRPPPPARGSSWEVRGLWDWSEAAQSAPTLPSQTSGFQPHHRDLWREDPGQG